MKGKYSRRPTGGTGAKVLMLVLALVLTATCSIGGTLAWMVTRTDAVVNTFTYGNIELELKETFNTDNDPNKEGNDCWTGKVVPGTTLKKDPTVTVKENSEPCWLFVKLEESENWPMTLDKGTSVKAVTYEVDDDEAVTEPDAKWTKLPDVTGVWYRKVVNPTDAAKPLVENAVFEVLKGNEVKVSPELTKGEIKDRPNFTLTVTAYACQLNDKTGNPFDIAKAWELVQGDGKTPQPTP